MSGADFAAVAYLGEHIDRFPGVGWRNEPMRDYRDLGALAHVIGYVGEISVEELQVLYNQGYRRGDTIGKSGLEQVHDRLLRGTPGLSYRTVDARERDLGTQEGQAPSPGHDLVLTIDSRTQRLAEDALAGRIGSVVVLRPTTGEILAMVSYPWFDPEAFRGGGRRPAAAPGAGRSFLSVRQPGAAGIPAGFGVQADHDRRGAGGAAHPAGAEDPVRRLVSVGQRQVAGSRLPGQARPLEPARGLGGVVQHLLLHGRAPSGRRARRPLRAGVRARQSDRHRAAPRAGRLPAHAGLEAAPARGAVGGRRHDQHVDRAGVRHRDPLADRQRRGGDRQRRGRLSAVFWSKRCAAAPTDRWSGGPSRCGCWKSTCSRRPWRSCARRCATR